MISVNEEMSLQAMVITITCPVSSIMYITVLILREYNLFGI